MNKKIKNIVILSIGLILLNVINQSFYTRLDLTSDNRYTLSKTTKNIVSKVDKFLFVTVYLEGDFPSEFKRLQRETRQYLEELALENSNIKINFEAPDKQQRRSMMGVAQPQRATLPSCSLLQCSLLTSTHLLRLSPLLFVLFSSPLFSPRLPSAH